LAADDAAVRVVLVSAIGDAYSAGNDLDFLHHPPGAEALVSGLIGRVADQWIMIIREVLAERGEALIRHPQSLKTENSQNAIFPEPRKSLIIGTKGNAISHMVWLKINGISR
jgi:hypothetical protein